MKNIIGYQIESADGLHNIPEGFYSFEVLTETVADKFLQLEKLNPTGNWVKVAIHEGDIEEPTIVEYL